MKKWASAAALGAVLAIVAAPVAASADPWPVDDTFTVGGANWDFDEYGIAYGWDAGNVYGSSGYIYYPGYFSDDSDYIYCPNYESSVVTTLDGGDVTIDCQPFELAGAVGLTATMHFRIYATESNGHLLRYQLDVENTTGADITPAVLESYFDVDGYVADDPSTTDFVSSSGATAGMEPGDDWFIAGRTNGASVFWSSAWSKTGTDSPLTANGGPLNGVVIDYSDVTFPANSTTHILQFTNLVIPAAQDDASADAAFEAAQTQSAEFADFCGRLSDGLEDAEYLGWGNPADCNAPVPPAKPTLADTGVDATGTAIAGALFVMLGAAALVVMSRRRARVSE